MTGVPYVANRRANRLEAWEIQPSSGDRVRLRLRGPKEVVDLLARLPGTSWRGVFHSSAPGWTSALLHQGQPPASVVSLLCICRDVLTIVPPPQLDLVHALDWYYDPPPTGTSGWSKRAAGRLVSGCKYDKGSDPSSIDVCGRMLAGGLAAMIDRHPLLSAVTAVAAVPGHDSKVTSTSRRLARTLAQHHLGLPLVSVHTRTNIRQASKDSTEAQLFDLRDDFYIAESLVGHTVLVVDDVVRTGGTMDSLGWALRRAGAAAIFGVAGAKTRRNTVA
jgi:hypothetical protein